jgi:hypothetical protein
MTTQDRILDLAEKVKNPPSWWWKVLGGLIFLAMAIWIRYLLSKRADALAAEKTEIAKRKYEAEQAAVSAAVEKDAQKRRLAEIAAAESLKAVKLKEDELLKLDQEHKKQVGLLQAVADKDWDALNKLAGVK